MRKTRVLHFPIGNTKGGITHYALFLWKYIDKSRFQFDFATMSNFLSFEEDLLESGANVYYISCYAEENPGQFCDEFRKILLTGKYDVVHLHTSYWKSTLAEEVAKSVGVKHIIVHAHSTGMDVNDSLQRKKILKKHNVIKKTLSTDLITDYLACSYAAANFLFGRKIPRGKIKIMHNAVDVNQYKYTPFTRMKIRKEMNLNDSFVIGHIGRFAYSKNQEFLIELIKLLKNIIPKVKLVLVGTGEKELECKKNVMDSALNEYVCFTGYRSDISDLLQGFDLFLLPSRFEGFPLSLVEAQCAGLYCLVSDKVSYETKALENVQFIPLLYELWIQEIINIYKSGYHRRDTTLIMKQAGYDIVREIGVIEKEYES